MLEGKLIIIPALGEQNNATLSCHVGIFFVLDVPVRE